MTLTQFKAEAIRVWMEEAGRYEIRRNYDLWRGVAFIDGGQFVYGYPYERTHKQCQTFIATRAFETMMTWMGENAPHVDGLDDDFPLVESDTPGLMLNVLFHQLANPSQQEPA